MTDSPWASPGRKPFRVSKAVSLCLSILRRLMSVGGLHGGTRERTAVYDTTEENCPEPCCALKAYAVYDKELGYCQGMAFVVGILLMKIPEDEAFCVLAALMKVTHAQKDSAARYYCCRYCIF